MKAVPADQLEETMAAEVEVFAHSAGIGGWDQVTDFWCYGMAVLDLAGLAAGRRMAGNAHVLSAIQRPGRSLTDRGGLDFHQTIVEKGLKAAIEERDAPFREYFPQPKPKKG
jgi:hypothetical protein